MEGIMLIIAGAGTPRATWRRSTPTSRAPQTRPTSRWAPWHISVSSVSDVSYSYLLPDTSLICLMSDMSPISVSPKSWLQCQCLIVSDVRSVSVVLVTILMSHSLRCPHCLRSLCACQQCPGVSWCVNTTEFTRTQTASFLRFNQIIKF